MIFTNDKFDEEQAGEFIREALIRQHRGDTQHIYDHFPAFLASEEGKQLLEKYHTLQKEVYTKWKKKFGERSHAEEEKATDAEQEEVQVEEKPPVDASEIPENEQEEASEDMIVIEFDSEEEAPETRNQEESEMNLPPRIHLPNGKAKAAYHFELLQALPEIDPEEIEMLEIEGLEASGLVLDSLNFHLSGTPKEADQFPLQIRLHLSGTSTKEFRADLDILPDPRALWKELEPEPSSPFPKPHTQAQILRGAEKTLLGASCRGRSHAHKAGFRDDHFALDYLDSGWYLMAVADGAGSAAYSRKGAALACETALDSLREADFTAFEAELRPLIAAYQAAPDEQSEHAIRRAAYTPLSQAAFAAYKAILALAEDMDASQKQFHTTLILTIARRFEAGWMIATWWVGDGGMGVYQQGQKVAVLGTPDGGEFAGQTRFLTMRDTWFDGEAIFGRIGIHFTEDFTALALMTDGITDPKFETDYNLGQLAPWDRLWADLQTEVDFSSDNADAPAQLLKWLEFWSPGNHDDRTIAILY